MLSNRTVLLIVSGGIAAYKSLELVRRLRDLGAGVRTVLTHGGSQFVTPLSLAALSGHKVYQELFSLTDEAEMGHIQLSRTADLVLVAPCTADLMAKMASGQADDLASTVLLATTAPVMMAPAMNVQMWQHPATRRNAQTLRDWGVQQIGPNAGALACGEEGFGRMAEPAQIAEAVCAFLAPSAAAKPLAGRRALVTSGPTHEPIDPVRVIANRSSGKQGHAIAAALAALGADVTLVSGPVALAPPTGVTVVPVETARQMLAASVAVAEAAPLDVAVCAAAVADWGVANSASQKMKKDGSGQPPVIELVQNPDILAHLSQMPSHRPRLVVGFAAETENLLDNARQKRARKGCDWICANDVSPQTGTFGGDANTVHLVSAAGIDSWPPLSKTAVAERLAAAIAAFLSPC